MQTAKMRRGEWKRVVEYGTENMQKSKNHVVVNVCQGLRRGAVEISELIDDILTVVVEHLLELLCGYVSVTAGEVSSIWNWEQIISGDEFEFIHNFSPVPWN